MVNSHKPFDNSIKEAMGRPEAWMTLVGLVLAVLSFVASSRTLAVVVAVVVALLAVLIASVSDLPTAHLTSDPGVVDLSLQGGEVRLQIPGEWRERRHDDPRSLHSYLLGAPAIPSARPQSGITRLSSDWKGQRGLQETGNEARSRN